MKTVSFKITGVRPLLMCNVRLADPTDPYTRRLKDIQSQLKGKNNGNLELIEQKLDVQWEGGLYWDQTMGVFLPSYNLEACIRDGAKKYRRGKDAQLIQAVDPVGYKVTPPAGFVDTRDLEAYRKDPRGALTRTVCMNGGSKVPCRRPMVPSGWSSKIEFEYDPELCSEEDIATWLSAAGYQCGIGTWRPKFGRFIVE